MQVPVRALFYALLGSGIMFQVANILSPVDPAAPHPALAQALFWARQYRATLHVVQVSPFEDEAPLSLPSQGMPSNAVRRLVEERARRAGLSLDGFTLRAVALKAPSRTEGLLCYVTEHAIDLIVAAPSSDSDGHRSLPALRDPTLTGLMQSAPCPVLTAGAALDSYTAPRRLLAPVDFSRHARSGLGHAKSLADLYDASLDVLHVLERPRYLALNDTDLLSLSDARLPERKALRRERSLFEEARGPDVETHFHVAHGSSADEIAAFATAHGSDLIVMSSHGSTGQSQHALGTVVTKTLRQLNLPVFLVKSFGTSLVPLRHEDG